MGGAAKTGGPGLLALLLAGLVVAPAAARASQPNLRLEWVDARGCTATGGELVLGAAEVTLEGTLGRGSPARLRLVVDGARIDRQPLSAVPFDRSGRGLALALVLQLAGLGEPDLEAIRAGLRDLARALPRETSYNLVVYDWEVRRLARGKRARLLRALDDLEPSIITADPALVEALHDALSSLPPARPDGRRLVVVVSDGINHPPSRDLFRKLGDAARKERVPILPVGYSAIDERGPLLNLGEVARRSAGTFRWARTRADLGPQLANLAREIAEQQVLSFSLPGGCASPHQVALARGPLVSRTIPVPALKRGPDRSAAEEAPSGGRPWLVALFIAGALVVGVGLVLLTRLLLRPRE